MRNNQRIPRSYSCIIFQGQTFYKTLATGCFYQNKLNKFKVKDIMLNKSAGIYKFEAIDNPIIVPININLKEYLKYYKIN